MRRVLEKLSYANVMATVAVFLALGGVGYAATQLPRNSVGAKQLKKGAVTPKKLSKASKKTLEGPRGPKGETGERGERGAPGPSAVYSAFNDGPVDLEEAPESLLSVPVPAGAYAIQAKASPFSQGGSDIVHCRLDAGGDFDIAEAAIGLEAGTAGSSTIATQVVHTFSSPGVVTIGCHAEGGGSQLAVKYIKISAIQVGAANPPS